MANFPIRGMDWNHPTTSPVPNKTAHLLPDGTRVAILINYNLASPGAGMTSDGTGVPKMYVYTAASDFSAWTLRATVSGAGLIGAGRIYMSSALDDANNIHLTYLATGGTLKYRLLTYSGSPAWTVGAEESVAAAPGTGLSYSWLDIDVAGVGASGVVIAANVIKTTVTKSSAVRVFVRNTTPAWVAHADVTMFSGDQPGSSANHISLCANRAAHASSVNTVMISSARKGLAGADFGDVFWATEINFTTGARVSNKFLTYETANTKAWNWGKANGARMYRIFCTGPDEFLIAGIVDHSPVWENFLYKVQYNRASDTFTDVISPRNQQVRTVGTTPTGTEVSINAGSGPKATPGGTRAISIALNGNNYGDILASPSGLIFIAHTTSETVGHPVRLEGNTPYWATGAYNMTNLVTPGGALAGQIWAANPRTLIDSTRLFWLSTHTASSSANTYKYYAWSRQAQGTPANVLPAAGSTVITDQPQLRADYRMPEQYTQMQVRMQWQIATDANFTTNVRTINGTGYVRADGTNGTSPQTIREIQQVTQQNELYQGTWFARAREVDFLGYVGAWSAAGAGFTVSHPPVASAIYPRTGTLVGFVDNGSGAHVMNFAWAFTDTSPSDTQTAHEIILTDRADDSQIFTTGKVVNTTQTGFIGIGSANKDKELGWSVRVWDSDDVAGPFTPVESFYLLDPTTVTITAPASGAVLTTAIPTVTWSHNLSGIRYQDVARVLITRASDGEVAYNSDWLRTTATTFAIPTGYLRNDTSYILRVDVRDNLMVEGFATRPFSTDWVDPSAPPQQARVSLVAYDKHGYVWVSQSPTGFDVDFVSYNLYRREVGTATWELINVWTDAQRLMTYADFEVGSRREYEYAVTQMVERFGDIIESPITSSIAVRVKPLSASHWLVFSDSESAMRLRGVNSHNFTDEYEAEVFHVIGLGRRREVGDRLGYTGQLTCQLRDKYMTGVATVNYLANPNFLGDEIVTGGVVTGIPGWNLVHTEVGNTVNQYLQGTAESLPSTAIRARVLETAAFGASDSMAYEQRIDNNKPVNLVTTGGQFSLWVAGVIDQQLVLTVRMYSAANALLNTATVTLTDEAQAVDVMTPSLANSADAGHAALAPSTEWRRYRLNVPAYTAQPVAYILVKAAWLREVGTGTETFTITGAQYQTGNTLTALVTGDMDGAWYDGDPMTSPSYTDGHYSARQQRQRLEAVRRRIGGTLLRNPFGDVYAVGVGDIGITLLPGVETEMSDATIPFMELAS